MTTQTRRHRLVRPQTPRDLFQSRTQPEGKPHRSFPVLYPRHRALQSKSRTEFRRDAQFLRQFLSRAKNALRIQKRGLCLLTPLQLPPSTSRNQVPWQLIQQAIKSIGRKCRGKCLSRHSSHQSCHPLQPRRIVYRRSHPLSVNRLSAKAPERHFTGVISCNNSHGKNTIWFCRGMIV